MTLKHERQITIATAGSRKATVWMNQKTYLGELYSRLEAPVRSTMTHAEYLQLTKAKQDDLKDVGGYIGGQLKNNRRKAANVIGRDLVTLDLDHIPAGGTANVLRRLEALGCAYAVYSTRKHEEAKPRLRVLLPLSRTATADEYEPIARKLGQIIGIELCDPTTFEAVRLMYWPSCCSDSQYVFQYGDKPMMDTDGLLGLFENWRNVAEWPQVPDSEDIHAKRAAKQADPTSKNGVVGAFCRAYNIYQALDAFLPDVYVATDDDSGRLTYTGGSTTGGAIAYDDGTFLYSHHATDPCSGQLVNAFDLVRLHKFGELDAEAKEGTPPVNMPSYVEMKKFALQDPKVEALMDQERYARLQDFNSVPNPTNWMGLLERNSNTGIPEKNTKNVQIVLEHDPVLTGRIYLDLFSDQIMAVAPLPWGLRKKQTGVFPWDDYDDDGLFLYMDKLLGMQNTRALGSAVRDHAISHAKNATADYLFNLTWDGKLRLDNLYIDYLGAEDCLYIRTITRKAFVAAVARAVFTPESDTQGVKFDTMTVVCGPQNIGKSTLFRKLGKRWFSDSVKTFEGKEAEEIIQGKWIVEIAELQAFSRADINRVKQFLSKLDDQYRGAFKKHVKAQLRRCVFFGTTNDHEYLRDPSGNRRFWPVDALIQEPTKSVIEDLTDTEVDQIWAEAVMRWRLGEPVFLSPEMEKDADIRRESHMERDALQGQIETFLEKQIPEDWLKWDVSRRNLFWSNGVTDTLKLVPRNRICALEVWRECLKEHRTMTKADATRINTILQQIPNWERVALLQFGADYGKQRGFKRIEVEVNRVNTPHEMSNKPRRSSAETLTAGKVMEIHC